MKAVLFDNKKCSCGHECCLVELELSIWMIFGFICIICCCFIAPVATELKLFENDPEVKVL